MKILWFLLFMNAAAVLFPDTITGQWWRYNPDSQDHDELIIDENLRFTLRATIAGKLESFEGQIQVIGGQNYYAQVDYNDAVKNGHLYSKNIEFSLNLMIYEDETEIMYRGYFERTKEFPQEKEKEEKKKSFVFQPLFGSSGGNFNLSNNRQTEYSLSVEMSPLNFIYVPAGLELEIIPVKYTYHFLAQSHIMSFFNIGLSWNILDFPLKREKNWDYLFLGPTFSVNWLNLYDFNYFNINNIIFSSGLKFSWGETPMKYLTLETGYRNTGGSHGYYFSILVDNIFPLLVASLPVIWPLFSLEWD